MSIHPNAIHWTKTVVVRNGRVSGSKSEIGCVYPTLDGWHAQVTSGNEDLGPFRTERAAQMAAEDFVNNGYVR